MTIYDTLLGVIKEVPGLKMPTWIIQFKYADYTKWEMRLRKLQEGIYNYAFKHSDEDKNVILRRDINDRTITIITDDDNLRTQPFIIHYDCQSIRSLSNKQTAVLWAIATEEIDKQRNNSLYAELKDGVTLLKIQTESIIKLNHVIAVYRSILADHTYDSINFYQAILNIINEFSSNMEKELAIRMKPEDFHSKWGLE